MILAWLGLALATDTLFSRCEAGDIEACDDFVGAAARAWVALDDPTASQELATRWLWLGSPVQSKLCATTAKCSLRCAQGVDEACAIFSKKAESPRSHHDWLSAPSLCEQGDETWCTKLREAGLTSVHSFVFPTSMDVDPGWNQKVGPTRALTERGALYTLTSEEVSTFDIRGSHSRDPTNHPFSMVTHPSHLAEPVAIDRKGKTELLYPLHNMVLSDNGVYWFTEDGVRPRWCGAAALLKYYLVVAGGEDCFEIHWFAREGGPVLRSKSTRMVVTDLRPAGKNRFWMAGSGRTVLGGGLSLRLPRSRDAMSGTPSAYVRPHLPSNGSVLVRRPFRRKVPGTCTIDGPLMACSEDVAAVVYDLSKPGKPQEISRVPMRIKVPYRPPTVDGERGWVVVDGTLLVLDGGEPVPANSWPGNLTGVNTEHRLEGRVTNDGKPVAGATLEVFAFLAHDRHSQWILPLTTTTTDERGRYDIDVGHTGGVFVQAKSGDASATIVRQGAEDGDIELSWPDLFEQTHRTTHEVLPSCTLEDGRTCVEALGSLDPETEFLSPATENPRDSATVVRIERLERSVPARAWYIASEEQLVHNAMGWIHDWDGSEAQLITRNAGERVEMPSLERSQVPPSRIRVVDVDGLPVAGAGMMCHSDFGLQQSVGHTDSDGWIEVPGAEPVCRHRRFQSLDPTGMFGMAGGWTRRVATVPSLPPAAEEPTSEVRLSVSGVVSEEDVEEWRNFDVVAAMEGTWRRGDETGPWWEFFGATREPSITKMAPGIATGKNRRFVFTSPDEVTMVQDYGELKVERWVRDVPAAE